MLGPPKPISSPCIPVCIDTVCIRRVRTKKMSGEQDLYKIFLFRHTHVTVDTYNNEVQYNAGHTCLYTDGGPTLKLRSCPRLRTGMRSSPPLLCLTRPEFFQGRCIGAEVCGLMYYCWRRNSCQLLYLVIPLIIAVKEYMISAD